jgi:membrane-associated phospholipid phosphatase
MWTSHRNHLSLAFEPRTHGMFLLLATLLAAPKAVAEGSSPNRPNARNSESHDSAQEPCPFCAITPERPRGVRGLHWHDHWERVGLREYVATPILFASAAFINFAIEPARQANFSGPILFDGPARDALTFDSQKGRETAKLLSDLLFIGSMVHPVVFDNFIVTLLIRASPDVAWQMMWINAQAYALTLATTMALKRSTSRERPWGEQCPEASDEHPCGSGTQFQSFYSGHASITATGAGLLCAHHTQLELYQAPILDTAACLSAVAITAATGTLRISSDNHWASDVLVGHLMGYVSGYLMPTLLYYKQFRIAPEPTDRHPAAPEAPLITLFPVVGPDFAEVRAIGRF